MEQRIRCAVRARGHEVDSVKRAALFVQMNELIVGDGDVLPSIDRTSARAVER